MGDIVKSKQKKNNGFQKTRSNYKRNINFTFKVKKLK